MRPDVLVIDENGVKLGNMSFEKAKLVAKEKNKDLVLVNKESSVYKIMDLGKFKYEQRRKERKQHAQQKSQKIKEIQVRPNIADADFAIKMKKVREFLKDGIKTKITMRFKSREILFKNSGLEKINTVVNQIVQEGLAKVDKTPAFEGHVLVVFLTPIGL